MSCVTCPYWALSRRSVCLVAMLLAVIVTQIVVKDDNSDAWSYHYYSGAMLLDQRFETDYFGASLQGYLNPLVHLPFAAMINAEWSDRLVALVMALYGGIAFVLLTVFYSVSLGLRNWHLIGAMAMSLGSLLVWTCTGSSFPDLFLQIPVFSGLLYLFRPDGQSSNRDYWFAAFLFGVALGLKLTAVIYLPGIVALVLLRLFRGDIGWFVLWGSALAGIAGFLLAYGWWGWILYREFGNPFFPFLNQWFKSPYFSTEAIANFRFISESAWYQALLPFRIAKSDAWVYMEIGEPDLRPGAFVFLASVFFVKRLLVHGRNKAPVVESDFLFFLMISLYVWVFISGNGRYGVGIFLLLGAGILLALRSLLSLKFFRSAFLLLLVLQFFVTCAVPGTQSGTSFRFQNSAWGGTWFNVDFRGVVGVGNQLVMTGTRTSYSVLAKDMGDNSSLINVYGGYPLENGAIIQHKIEQYGKRVLGMVMAPRAILTRQQRLSDLFFDQFGRFGLALGDYTKCQFLAKVRGDDTRSGFIFCPLVRSESSIGKYDTAVGDARKYFQRIEEICPKIFSPTGEAIILSDRNRQKNYANYEIDVYIDSKNDVYAKKSWSMMIFPLGSLAETFSMSPDVWREKYCEPLRRSKAMSKE